MPEAPVVSWGSVVVSAPTRDGTHREGSTTYSYPDRQTVCCLNPGDSGTVRWKLDLVPRLAPV